MSKELKEKARQLLESGAEVDEVAKETGLKVAAVRGILGAIAKQRKKKPGAVQPDQEPPSLGAQLRQILDDYGYRKTDAVLSLVESYGFSVPGIHAALKDAGAPLSVIRYTLKRWSAYQNLIIPEYISREIGPRRSFHEAGYREESGLPRDVQRDLRDRDVKIAKLEE